MLQGGAGPHESDDLAKGHAAVQILEGGGLFPRITAWAEGVPPELRRHCR